MKELPKEAIIELQKIYKKVYGKKITYQEAIKLATSFLHLYAVVYLNSDKFFQINCQKRGPRFT